MPKGPAISPRTMMLLDRFGPFGSAIGGLIGFTSIMVSSYIGGPIGIFTILAWILPYALNTCVHRRYLVFSMAAFAGLVGTLVGGIIGAGLVFFMGLSSWAAPNLIIVSALPACFMIFLMLGGMVVMPVSYGLMIFLELEYSMLIPWAFCIMVFSYVFSRQVCEHSRQVEWRQHFRSFDQKRQRHYVLYGQYPK